MQATMTPTVRLFVVVAVVMLAPLFISGVEGSVSRTFNEACAVWNARALYQSQPTPQWLGSSLDCATGGPGVMQELVPENVLDQFNLYRTLAGLPNVTLNGTKSDGAQAAAWWDAALIQAGGCDPNNLDQCWANTSSPCYTEDRQTRASSIHLHQVRLGGTYFDVASILEAGYHDIVLYPETTSIGIGMYGNETGVNGNFTGFSCQTIDAAGAPSSPNRRDTTSGWYAYPPDGVLEVSAMSGLRMWKFVTQAPLGTFSNRD
ncbi:uncharacterized protein ACA1_305510 [Acanthamoeba castellanii str. Neff]|uniref:SCPlike extracellular subfamily protein n=1 Tax=Acanthamoeba castellanii (strain ATCC 30010 / Neff) TaxID=1257118 RepID=L8GNC7_ACACF|nr:uncharacterized protein ACA1_305510 [Acanthamoeba castellanii str. Neff]ELR13721.1 hypothetical protein ACA1_305510 [Acanthamoeba castellanii str. Neff]